MNEEEKISSMVLNVIQSLTALLVEARVDKDGTKKALESIKNWLDGVLQYL